VAGAVGAYRDRRIVPNTIWTYGEQYSLPDVVASTPGLWAARIVHGGAAPVAVVFTVLPGGRLAEASARRVSSAGWQESWSKPLELRALAMTEVDRLTAKLPRSSSNQPFDDVGPQRDRLEPPIRISSAAVRALFRSKQLAETWHAFLELNRQTVHVQPAAAGARRSGQRESVTEKRTKLRAMRAQIEQLIKSHGGPWKTEERPRS
jgi:hypothetical protein